MDVQDQKDESLQKVAELVKDIKFAMMTTEDEQGCLRSRPMTTMQMDADGSLWIGTSVGLMRVRDGQVDEYLQRAGFYGDAVFVILDDEAGNLWLSSNRGIARLVAGWDRDQGVDRRGIGAGAGKPVHDVPDV